MTLTGDFTNLTLADLIQVINLRKQTGVIHVRGVRGEQTLEGAIYFREGAIYHTRTGDIYGEDAAHLLFTYDTGSFHFTPLTQLPSQNVFVSNEVVIIEGIAWQAAWRQIAPALLSTTLVVRIVPEPRCLAAETVLEADEWQVLTLINGKRSIDQLAQNSAVGMLRTYQVVSALLARGLIEYPPTGTYLQPLQPELERIIIAMMGARGRVLLLDAYHNVGLRPTDGLTPQQTEQLLAMLEQVAIARSDPVRARDLVQQIRTQLNQQSQVPAPTP